MKLSSRPPSTSPIRLRAAYLDSTCPDPDTRKRLDALLAAHDKAGDFMARPAVERPVPETAPTRAYAPETDHTRTHGGTVDTDTDDALGFLATPRRADSLGRIGHYEVLEVLGRGGFGIVFRAFDETLQRVVAVKVLAPSMAATSPARKRFLREARHAGNVRHENVVQIHDISRDEERLPYLVMEFIPGETLQQRLDRTGPLDVAEILRIGKQIAAGLASAHEMNLVHRDIKPSNILIDTGPEQRVKITDFGLARAADDASISQSGVVAGTPMYMAPEQAKGEALDHRADLFSLGSVLYVMCSGRPPFRAGSTLAVLKRVCEERPRPIREIIPEVPDWLCRIIDKLHAKDPAERYQSAKEVAEVLADCERQIQTNAALADYSRIPIGKPIRNYFPLVVAGMIFLVGLPGLATIYIGVVAFRDFWPTNVIAGVALAVIGAALMVRYLVGYRHRFEEILRESLEERTRALAGAETKAAAQAVSQSVLNWMMLPIGYFALMGIVIAGGTFLRWKFPDDFGRYDEHLESIAIFTFVSGIGVLFFAMWRIGRIVNTNSAREFTSARVPITKPVPAQATETMPVWAMVLLIIFAPIGMGVLVNIIGRWIAPEDFDDWNQGWGGVYTLLALAPILIVLSYRRYRQQLEAIAPSTRAPGPAWRFGPRRSAVLGLVFVLLLGSLYFGRAAILYSLNQSEMEIAANEGFNSVIVLRNDLGEFNENEVKPMVTDWMGMETGRTLKLPPGKYQLNASISPSNRKIIHWKVMTSGPFGSNTLLVPGEGSQGWSVIVNVERGQRLSVWPVPEDLAAVAKRNDDELKSIRKGLDELQSELKGFVPLFNGKDLTGWTPNSSSATNWRVEDGAIVGTGGQGYLVSAKTYDNFHLRVEAKLNSTGNGGVGFGRAHQIEMRHDPLCPIGSIMEFKPNQSPTIVRFPDPPPAPDTWFTLEFRVVRGSVAVRVNGGTWKSPRVPRAEDIPSGPLELEAFDDKTQVRFRKIEIKELTPASSGHDKPIAGWGTIVDPKRDCKFDEAAGALTIAVPAGKYNLNPTPEFNNLSAPRVLRSASGDFQFEARVDPFPLPPAGPDGVKDSYVGAGLLLWQDERNFVRFIRAANGATRKEYIHFEYFRDGQLAVSTALNFPNPPTALRVVRTGNDFRYYWSFDETKWVEYPVKVPVSLTHKVDVGVCAINTLETPFSARFSDPQFRAAWAVQGFVSLFNGKDLTGWTGKFPNAWSVEDGILFGRGKNGSTDGWSELVHPRSDFKDFHLRAQTRINASGWAGIRVRKQKNSLDGYKIWLSNDPEKTGARTGRLDVVGKDDALTITNPPDDLRVPVDEWFTLDLVARGPELVLSINGQEAARVNDPSFVHGEIQLEVAGAATIVQFRKIEIKELPPAPPVPFPTELDRADLAKLKGEWDAHQRMFDGKFQTLGGGKSAGIRFGDGDFEHWETEGKETRRQTGTFRVEASNKQVLLYFKDQIVPVRVAYRADGDLLRLSFAGLPGTDGKSKGPPLRAPERMTSQNNLKQISLAMHNYLDTHKALPQAAITNVKAKDGKPLLSWRVALLPYIEENELYKQFKLDEPWDSEHNKKLIAKIPRIFATPGIATPQPGMTHYRVFAGPGTVFEPRPGKEHGWPLTEIPDGTAGTLMIVEAADPVIWTKPDDLAFDPKKPLPKLGVYESAIHVAMCDGMIHALDPNAPEATIRALATRNGGERVSAPVLAPAPDQAPPFHMDLRRKGSLPAGAVVLRTFDPAKDKAVPLRGDASKIVRVEDGAWRIENSFDRSVSGNFRVALGAITEGIPEDGVLILRAKVKLKPNAENGGWGDLELNGASPSFHGYDWPDHLATYKGDITEWAEKEVRYPMEVIRKKNPPTITVHVGLHGNGVLWVKDLELLHIPAPDRSAPAPPAVPPAKPVAPDPTDPVVLQSLRDLIASTAKSRDLVKARFDAGTVSKIALLAAEADVVDARIRLAEAEGKRDEVVALHEVLVAHRKEERDLIALRVDAGAEAVDVLSKADARLADAKVRLAKLKPPAAAAPAPRQKP